MIIKHTSPYRPSGFISCMTPFIYAIKKHNLCHSRMTGTGGRCSLTEPEVLAGYILKEEVNRRSKVPFVSKITTAFIPVFLRPHHRNPPLGQEGIIHMRFTPSSVKRWTLVLFWRRNVHQVDKWHVGSNREFCFQIKIKTLSWSERWKSSKSLKKSSDEPLKGLQTSKPKPRILYIFFFPRFFYLFIYFF